MSIYREKQSGNWYIDLRHEGDRRRVKSPENSKKGAQAYETHLRRRLANGEALSSFGQKSKEAELVNEKKEVVPVFKVFVEDWLETYVRTNNKPSEMIRKKSILTKHLRPFFGSMLLEQIDVRSIERYKADRLADGLSPKTINNQLTVLRKALVCAFEWSLLGKLPQVKWLKTVIPKVDFLTDQEAERLLADEDEELWNVMILLALRTGMRISEMLALHWNEIDFVESQVCVRYSLSNREISSPKNNHIRYIDMTLSLRDRLKEWKQSSGGKLGLVFPSPVTSGLLNRNSALEALYRACARVGIRRVGWHTLRHTFATQLTAKGVPIRTVQALLGHLSLKMTERYAHVAPDMMRNAVMVLEGDWVSFGQYVGSREKMLLPVRPMPHGIGDEFLHVE